MEQYIPKSALLAEIEKIRRIEVTDTDVVYNGALDEIRHHIDTLEVKEIDFHKELLSFYRHTNDSGSEIALAKYFYELGLKAAQKGEEI